MFQNTVKCFKEPQVRIQIVGNFFDMDIDDDCIPFKKEKNILKNELGKKTPNSFLHLRKELT